MPHGRGCLFGPGEQRSVSPAWAWRRDFPHGEHSAQSLHCPESWGLPQFLGWVLLVLLQNFLYKAIGVGLAACADKDVVRKQLQELLDTARYQEEAEREVGRSMEICGEEEGWISCGFLANGAHHP